MFPTPSGDHRYEHDAQATGFSFLTATPYQHDAQASESLSHAIRFVGCVTRLRVVLVCVVIGPDHLLALRAGMVCSLFACGPSLLIWILLDVAA